MSETPNARMLGLAAILKWTQCGKGFFCVLALLAVLGLCAQNADAQYLQDSITITNPGGEEVFRLDLYGENSDYSNGPWFIDGTGAIVNGTLTSARDFLELEKQALTRGLKYWAEVVAPTGSAPITPVVVRAGVDYDTSMNAGAFPVMHDATGTTYPYQIFGAGNDPGLYPSNIPGDQGEGAGFHSLMLFNDTWWGYDPNSQLMESVRNMESVMIHEFGHSMGIASSTPAWAAALQGAPGNMTFNGTEAATVYGDGVARPVPMTHFSGQEDSHPGLQNGLMSHQMFRNYSAFMEVELASLRDIGYKSIDLRNFFGRSIYTDGNTITNDNGFYKSNGLNGDTWLGYAGTANESSHGLGLHIYGSGNTVLQNADLLSIGESGGGIRVDGFDNTVIVNEGVEVQADGNGGTGLLVAFGTGHHIVNRGNIHANGNLDENGVNVNLDENGEYVPNYAPAVGVRFDFGPAFVGTGEPWDSGRSYGYVLDSDLNDVALDGALVDQFDVTGSISGTDAAIYIASNAHVLEINMMQGAVINGDIISAYTDNGLTTSLTFGKAADANGMATAREDGGFDGDTGFNFFYDSGDIIGSFVLETWGGETTLGKYDEANGLYSYINVQSGIVGQGTEDSRLNLPGYASFTDLTITENGTLNGESTGVLVVEETLENNNLVHQFSQITANEILNNGVIDQIGSLRVARDTINYQYDPVTGLVVRDPVTNLPVYTETTTYGNLTNASTGTISNIEETLLAGTINNAGALRAITLIDVRGMLTNAAGGVIENSNILAKSIDNAGTIQGAAEILVLSRPGVEGSEPVPGTTTYPATSPKEAIPAVAALYGTLDNDGSILNVGTITAGMISNGGMISGINTTINVLAEGATEGFASILSTETDSRDTYPLPAVADTPNIYGNFINEGIVRDFAGNITNNGGVVSGIATLRAGNIQNEGFLEGIGTIEVISKSATDGFAATPATYTAPGIDATAATPNIYGTLANNREIIGVRTIRAGVINNNGLIAGVDDITVMARDTTPGFAATPGVGNMPGTAAILEKPAVYGDFNVGSDAAVFDNQGNYVSGSVVQGVGNITTGNFNNDGLVAGVTGNIDVKKTLTNNGILAGVGQTLMVGESVVNNGYIAAINEIQTPNFQNFERGIVAGVNTIIMASNFTKDGTITVGNVEHVYTGVNYEAGDPIFDNTTGALITNRGTFVNQGGTIAVGSIESIAGLIEQPEATGVSTLTIDGNFESTSGTFIVGLGEGLDTNEAFINVVNGDARISGGTVDIVIADGMNYLADQKFTLISVDEGLDPANPYRLIVDPSAPLIAGDISDPLFTEFFNIAFVADEMSFNLTATRSNTYSNIGTTMNQRAVGKYIDTATIYPSGDFRNVLLALKDTRAGAMERMQADNTYTITSDPIEACLAQLAGSIYGTETASSFRNTVMVHTTLANVLRRDYNHVSAATDAYLSGGMMRLPSDNLWGMIYGHAGSSQFDGNTNGYRQGFSGIMVGFDRKNDQRNRFGFFLSAGDGSLSSDLNDRSLSKELMLGHYFRKDTDSTYMLLQAGFGTHRYDTRRHMEFGSLETGNYINRTALNEHSSFLFTSHFETGLKYRGGIFNLSPYVGLEYTGLLREGFTENSAGSLNLTAEREDYHVVRPMFGLRFDSAPFRVQKALASFYGNVAWMYEFEANKRPSEFEAQFTEAGVFTGSTYTVHGNDPGRDWVQAGFGLNADLNSNLRVFAGYDAYANSQQVLHSANLGFMLQR